MEQTGLVPVKVVAPLLGISRSKLYHMASRREIAHHRIGGKILFSDADIREYLASCRVGRGDAPSSGDLKYLR